MGLRDLTKIRRACKGRRRRRVHEELKLDAGIRGIGRVSVTLPIAGIHIHLDVSAAFVAIPETQVRTLEIRTRLAIPLPEVKHLNNLSPGRRPPGAILAGKKPRLDLNLGFSNGQILTDNASQSGAPIVQALHGRNSGIGGGGGGVGGGVTVGTGSAA